jgi:hypothetical protein
MWQALEEGKKFLSAQLLVYIIDLWNIHWEIMDFIHPRFFSLLDLCFSRSTKHGSRWWFNHGQDLEGVNGSRKVRMILAWFGERKSGGAVERGRNEL